MRDSGWSSHEPLAAASSSGGRPLSVGGFDVASGGYGPISTYPLRTYGGECSSSSGGTGSFGYLAPLHSIGNRISSKVPLSVRLNNFDYTTESSSVNSTNPFYNADTNRHMPSSITTTSKFILLNRIFSGSNEGRWLCDNDVELEGEEMRTRMKRTDGRILCMEELPAEWCTLQQTLQ
uniref:Uncharacterized protein n=1 Tax=Parascaris equorum TaxID=6256 RepID=A0A914RIB8_PAREQ